MPRKSIYSTSLLAQVRRHFGLHQHELAAYLGISPELVKHVEAGRRSLTAAVGERLRPLLQQLPTEPEPPTAAPPAFAPPDPAPLLARLDYCQHHAGRLRRQLRVVEKQLAQVQGWQQALPALLAAAGTEEPARSWLLRRQAEATAEAGPQAARYHLLRLRAEALEAEAAALARLLPIAT